LDQKKHINFLQKILYQVIHNKDFIIICFGRTNRERIFSNPELKIKATVLEPKENPINENKLDKNDLYGWSTATFHGSYIFFIKIFPYPLQDVVTAYDGTSYTYQLNGLSAPFLSEFNSTKPKRNHFDILDNIKNK